MKQFTTCFLLLFALKIVSQDYYESFVSAIRDRNTAKENSILKAWDAAEPNNPDLFTSYFNHFIVQSKQNILMMGDNPPANQDVLSIHDSVKKNSYLYDATLFKAEPFEKAMMYIDSGLKMYPRRLDMHFGKIHILGEAKDWNSFTKTILQTLNIAKKINNSWLWTKNSSLPEQDSIAFFLGAIQDYQIMIYNTGKDSLLKYMREIGLKTIEQFPTHIESYSNIGITYMILEENKKGLNYFLKGIELKPNDEITLSNIAQCYLRLKNTKKAIEYYQRAFDVGDKYTKQIATEKLLELKGDK